MRDEELARYLSSAKRKLRKLGPIERRRVLARIRQDVMELATNGMIVPPRSEDVRQAISAMPDPEKLAVEYMRTSHPPRMLIKVASGLNSLFGLAGAIVAGIILSTILGYGGWGQPIFLVGVSLLFLSGVFVFAAYVLAIISPFRASRIRYVILVPLTLCIIIECLLALWIPLQMANYAVYGIALLLLILLGGIYSVSYVHGQLPRLARSVRPRVTKRDYFHALASLLSDLDLVRRKEVKEELEQHVESKGLNLAELSAREAYSSIEEILGRPEDVADAYLRDAPKELPGREKHILAVVRVPALIGVPLGAALIMWNMFSERVVMKEPAYLTPLGLVGSIGLLILSLAVIGYLMRVSRAPPKMSDHLFPAAVLSLVVALIVSSTVAGVMSDGIIRPHDFYTYPVVLAHVADDGEMDILWGESLCDPDDPFYGCEPVGESRLYVTRLDQERRIISTERVPWGPVRGSLLDFERYGDSWVTLSSDSLHAWGAVDTGIGIDVPEGVSSVAGRIDGSIATLVSEIYSPSRDSVTIIYRQFDWLDYENETVWSMDFDLSGEDERLTGVLMSEDSVLVLIESHEDNVNYSRSGLVGFLFDSTGNSIANTTVHEVNLTKSDSEEVSTHVRADQIREGSDAFWLSLTSKTTYNGTVTKTSWLVRVDADSSNSTSWKLHEEHVPVPSYEFQDGDMRFHLYQNMFLTEDRVIVGSYWRYSVWRTGVGWQFNSSLGGRYIASISTNGEMEYYVRLGSVELYDYIVPLLSAWEDAIMVLVPSLPLVMNSRNMLTAYLVQGSAPTVKVQEITISFESMGLLFRQSRVGGGGVAIAPGVADFAGMTFSEDPGLFKWKHQLPVFWVYPTENYVALPMFARVDLNKLEITSVSLTAPKYAPDTVAGLLLTGIGSSVAVALLHFGYRWTRMRRSRRSHDELEQPSLTR